VAPAPTATAEVAEVEASAAQRGDDDPLAALDDLDDLLGDKKVVAKLEGATGAAAPARDRRESDIGPVDGELERVGAAEAPAGARLEAMASESARGRNAEAQPPPPAEPQAFPAADVAQPASASAPKAKRSTQSDERTPSAPSSGAGPAAEATRLSDSLRPSSASANGQAAPSQASLLVTARAIARDRGCAAALGAYERAIAAAPNSADAGAALIDMAVCKRSLGRTTEARAHLQRAAAIPSTASRARALLDAP
jgi:hypothetical protein